MALADPLSSSGSYGVEQRAEELYLDGVEKRAAGHADFARQTFESVVSRYPASEAAEHARRDLAELNANDTYAGRGGDSLDSITVTGALPTFAGETRRAGRATAGAGPVSVVGP
ncbi:MAG: hypothetical protein WDN31_17805 [Hyphomicrobium sp.]